MRFGKYRFGIQVEDIIVSDIQGNEIELNGKGYARFMMGIMIYCLERHIDLPTDVKLPGDLLTIGICADSSDGFWGNIGMKMGKYSVDGDRWNSRVSAADAGYDLEFSLFDWKRWVFTSTKKGGFKKKSRTKKKKRGKSKGRGKTKRHRSRRRKRKTNKYKR